MEKFKIELDCDMVDKITRANLVDMLKTIDLEIEYLEKKSEEQGDSFRDHLKIDLHDAKRHKKDLVAIIRYMSVKKDLEPFGLEHICDY